MRSHIPILVVLGACGGGEGEHHHHHHTTNVIVVDQGEEEAAEGDEVAPTADEAAVDEAVPRPGGDALPVVAPAGWDPIAFNRDRGNAGAIPESYRTDINGPQGVTNHLGKHLPYVPDTTGLTVPSGVLPLMWGDADKGYARHPNSPAGDPVYPKGHWYDWVRVRKAVEGEASEVETTFASWPDGDGYLLATGPRLEYDAGRNTIYLVRLPADVESGDTVRVWAHCLYHGEYVDFVQVP